MALTWEWNEKCGEITLEQKTESGDWQQFPLSLYKGNAFLIMLAENDEDNTYQMFGFFADKEHAKACLGLADRYMMHLDGAALQLANVTVTDEKLEKLLNEMFPLKENATDRQKNTVKAVKDEFMICYFMPDLAKFRGTGWGVVNAMADMVDHSKPRRDTGSYRENNWARIMDGHELVDRVTAKVMDMVGGLVLA